MYVPTFPETPSSSTWKRFNGSGNDLVDISSIGNDLQIVFVEASGSGTTIDIVDNLNITGDISASGDLFASDATFEDSSVTINIGGSSGDGKIIFKDAGTAKFSIGRDNTDNSFRISEGSSLGTNDAFKIAAGGATTFNHAITASGNISASGVVSASTLHIKDDNLQFEVGVNTITSIHQSTGTHNSSDFL